MSVIYTQTKVIEILLGINPQKMSNERKHEIMENYEKWQPVIEQQLQNLEKKYASYSKSLAHLLLDGEDIVIKVEIEYQYTFKDFLKIIFNFPADHLWPKSSSILIDEALKFSNPAYMFRKRILGYEKPNVTVGSSILNTTLMTRIQFKEKQN